MNIGELAKFRGGIATDTISEQTSASGVTIDGTLIKDGGVSASGTVSANTITEYTSGSGVTIDGVILKDNKVTASSGITFGDETLSTYDEGTWTPAISAESGSITSYTSSGTYVKIGRQVTLNFTFKITNNGTGSGSGVLASLPFTANSQGGSAAIRSAGSGGHTISVQLLGGQTSAGLWKYDNTYPFATNTECWGTLVYQV